MPGGRPKGSKSALGARASRRNLGQGPAGKTSSDKIADRRERAKMRREEADAIRAELRAQREADELCRRAEARAEAQRLAQLVRSELDRAVAYLDPGLAPEVRAAAEAAIGTATRKLRAALGGQAAA